MRVAAAVVVDGALFVIYATGNQYARYDATLDRWDQMSSDVSLACLTPVWSGRELVLWEPLGGPTAIRFDPARETSEPMTREGEPTARYVDGAVWTGAEMLVWGGDDENGNTLNTGGLYRPPDP
jgi:hypothetical protein